MFERVNASLGADWTLHDLRHSAASRMSRDKELSLTDVQWVMGHAHLTTTEIYLTPTRDEVIEGVLAHHARQSRVRKAPPRSLRRAMTCSPVGAVREALMTAVANTWPAGSPGNLRRRPRSSTGATASCGEQFPPRPAQPWWPETAQGQASPLRRLTSPPFTPQGGSARAARRRGTARSSAGWPRSPGTPGSSAGRHRGVEAHPGPPWVELPLAWPCENGQKAACDAGDLSSGLLMLACGDVVRPRLAWMLTRAPHHHLALGHGGDTRSCRVRRAARAGRGRAGAARKDARLAATRIATLLACKGGVIGDIAVGDGVELADTQRRCRPAAARRKSTSTSASTPSGSSPQTPRPRSARSAWPGTAHRRGTRRPLPAAVQAGPRPARGLPAGTAARTRLRQHAGHRLDPGRPFWARIEALSPGISTLRLPPDVARAWKEDLLTVKRSVTGPDGQKTVVTRPRLNAKGELLRVRAFYLDIAQWATEEPERWAQWAVPSPVSDAEVSWAKERRRRKARMDQRTRERLPVLPVLTRTAAERKNATASRLQAAIATPPGEVIEGTGGTLRRAVAPKATGRHVWAEDTAAGKRRNLSYEEEEAFWAFAAIEVLRLTGIRCEELLELTHHSITEYRLPTTGELVPLLQIAPSKTDTERLLLVSPELADVLSAIIRRVRGPGGAVPLTVSYDIKERVWNPPMPLLFQRSIGSENRAYTPNAIRNLLINALAATGLTDTAGDPLMFSPHDFRRIFVTDAIMSGLPPHIAQVICGHKNIDTTIGYKAVYPAEAIEAHRAFIARRRATRPSEEYRTPTDEEWDAFLAHFEKRKVSVGTCARAFASPCVHEHACVRCSLLRPDPAQHGQLEEIRDNLLDRIAEAEREGWLGEIEGLKVSLAGTEDKLAQIDTALQRREQAVHLGMPAFPDIAGRSVPPAPGRNPVTTANPRRLGDALRACARGIHPLEAGTGLLIDCGSWLHREDFTSRFITTGTSISDGITLLASTDWEAAVAALHAGELPASGGERQMLLSRRQHRRRDPGQPLRHPARHRPSQREPRRRALSRMPPDSHVQNKQRTNGNETV